MNKRKRIAHVDRLIVENTIALAIDDASRKGLTKQLDVAIVIMAKLEDFGFRISRRPRAGGELDRTARDHGSDENWR